VTRTVIALSFKSTLGSVAEPMPYMRTDAFAANPAGVEIDPEVLLAQFRSGVPERTTADDARGSAFANPEAHGMS